MVYYGDLTDGRSALGTFGLYTEARYGGLTDLPYLLRAEAKHNGLKHDETISDPPDVADGNILNN